MAANTSPIFGLTPNITGVSLANADGTTAKTVYTPGANGSRLGALSASSTDTATHFAVVSAVISSTSYQLGYVTIPNGAGTSSGVPPVNLLAGLPWLDADGAVRLPNGVTITVAMDAAVTSGKTIYIVSFGADF